MSGQSAMKTVKEVKGTLKSLECNNQIAGKGAGGTEMNSNAHPGSRNIGKK